MGVPLIAFGFAEYLSYFFPGIDLKFTAMGVVVFFALLNVLGIGVANWVQAFLVVELVLALLVFSFGGFADGDTSMMVPLLPNGTGVLFSAAIPAYMAYLGFLHIADLAEEIQEPHRTIPRALGFAFTSIVALYVLVCIALVMILPWSELGQTHAALAVAAESFLPGWAGTIMGISALAAAATTVNGIIAAQAREILAAARDRLLPASLDQIDDRLGTPVRAILLVTVLAMSGVLWGASITSYASLVVLAFMIFQGLVGLALWHFPKRLPDQYAASRFKLSPGSRRFFRRWSDFDFRCVPGGRCGRATAPGYHLPRDIGFRRSFFPAACLVGKTPHDR